MAYHVVTSFVLIISFAIFSAHGFSCHPQSTTPSFRDIVKGRCEMYQQFVNSDRFCGKGRNSLRNCSELADIFIKSFSHKPQCNVSLGSFDDFIRLTHHDVTPNKSLFWTENMYDTVHEYSQNGLRMETLENTMTGYLIDKLRFCASPEEPGLTFSRPCPGFYVTKNCPLNAEFSFWASASTNFAQQASGEATVMINASESTGFRLDSFFGKWEVPNMNPSKVKKLHIWLVTKPGQETRVTCQSDSIQTLKSVLIKKNINWKCTDNPRNVLWLLCTDHPDEKVCKELTSSTSSSASFNKITFSVMLMLVLGLLL